MKYRVTIVYGALVCRTYEVSAPDRLGAINAACALDMRLSLPPVAFWQPPFYSVEEIVEQGRGVEVRVLKGGRAA